MQFVHRIFGGTIYLIAQLQKLLEPLAVKPRGMFAYIQQIRVIKSFFLFLRMFVCGAILYAHLYRVYDLLRLGAKGYQTACYCEYKRLHRLTYK